MEEQAWKSLVIEVTEYIEADETLGEGLSQVLRLNLQIGTENPDERDACRTAMRVLCKGRAGSPFKKGKKPSIPTSVRISIDKVCGVVDEAAVAFFEHDAIIATVVAGRGGALYEDSNAYAKSVSGKVRRNLGKAFKAGTWDGEINSLLTSDSEE
jgi:hypothetical protein